MLRFFRRLLFLFNSYSPNSPLNLWNINLTIVIFFLFFLSFFGNPALALGWAQSWFLVNSFSGMFCKKSKGQRGDASSPEPMPGFGGKEQGRGPPFPAPDWDLARQPALPGSATPGMRAADRQRPPVLWPRCGTCCVHGAYLLSLRADKEPLTYSTSSPAGGAVASLHMRRTAHLLFPVRGGPSARDGG